MNVFLFARRLLVLLSVVIAIFFISAVAAGGTHPFGSAGLLLATAAGIAAMWAAAWGLGWAVRGLFGIPMGRDRS